MKRPTCPFDRDHEIRTRITVYSTRVTGTVFRHRHACRDCGHAWQELRDVHGRLAHRRTGTHSADGCPACNIYGVTG